MIMANTTLYSITVDGFKVTGKLSKCKKYLILKKGMICSILDTDVLECVVVEKKERQKREVKLLDTSMWFYKSGQI